MRRFFHSAVRELYSYIFRAPYLRMCFFSRGYTCHRFKIFFATQIVNIHHQLWIRDPRHQILVTPASSFTFICPRTLYQFKDKHFCTNIYSIFAIYNIYVFCTRGIWWANEFIAHSWQRCDSPAVRHRHRFYVTILTAQFVWRHSMLGEYSAVYSRQSTVEFIVPFYRSERRIVYDNRGSVTVTSKLMHRISFHTYLFHFFPLFFSQSFFLSFFSLQVERHRPSTPSLTSLLKA